MKPSRWLPLLCLLLLAVFAVGALPMLDEESYLDMASQVASHRGQPYGWWRAWQPWGNDPAGDTSLFAHPPLHWLWLSLWQPMLGDGFALRLVSAGPWALLLGWAVGRLCELHLERPAVGAVLWLCSPVVLLGLQLSLMVDLPVLALSTAAVALWSARKPELAGALLAAACFVKYPALVIWGLWIPLAIREPRVLLRAAWPFALLFAGSQAFLYASTGHIHLLHVLEHAGEIGRGPLMERAIGTLVRLGLTLTPGAGSPTAAGVAALPAGLSVLGLELDGGVLLTALLAGWGGALLAMAALALKDSHRRILGLWALLCVGAVIFGHNYVGGRYLLPATVPLALLGAQHLERWLPEQLRAYGGLVALPWAVLGLAMVHAERKHAQAWAELAEAIVLASPEKGVFTGEWTFRYVMREKGWTYHSPAPLPPGSLIAVPKHASPGLHPEGEQLWAGEFGGPGLRLVDLEQGVGYHAETLGPRPLAWSEGPLASGQLIRVER